MGANGQHYPVRSRNREICTVEGSFAPNGAGVVDPTQLQGRGVTSVVKTGNAGEFIVTLEESWNRLLYPDFAFALAVPLKVSACAGLVVLAPAAGQPQTITFVVYDAAGNPLNIAANAANRIYFHFRMQATGQDP